jgi:hypothetical protein
MTDRHRCAFCGVTVVRVTTPSGVSWFHDNELVALGGLYRFCKIQVATPMPTAMTGVGL